MQLWLTLQLLATATDIAFPEYSEAFAEQRQRTRHIPDV